MRLNTLAPAAGEKHKKKRVGRGMGSGLGKTAGRGHKGQKSRAGSGVKAGFEGGQMPLQRRLPKSGFKSRKSLGRSQVRLSDLNKITDKEITLDVLKKHNIVTKNTCAVKIILAGEVHKALTVKGLGVTKGARAAIEAAKGSIKDLEQ